MDDKLARDIVALDVSSTLGVTDWFVLASAPNDRQVRAIVDNVEERLREDLDRRPQGREGLSDSRWVLLDYGDVVVHVFLEAVRDFYQLERLWSDAPRLEWREPGAERAATS